MWTCVRIMQGRYSPLERAGASPNDGFAGAAEAVRSTNMRMSWGAGTGCKIKTLVNLPEVLGIISLYSGEPGVYDLDGVIHHVETGTSRDLASAGYRGHFLTFVRKGNQCWRKFDARSRLAPVFSLRASTRFSLRDSVDNERADVGRDGWTHLATPNSQAQSETGKSSFFYVQLTTSRRKYLQSYLLIVNPESQVLAIHNTILCRK